jgi:hypothetical protein
MPERTAPKTNEPQPPAARSRYEAPRLLALDELPRGYGMPWCPLGPSGPAPCSTGDNYTSGD